MAQDEGSTAIVVSQRIRNRLIEYLEMVVDYRSDPPPFDMNEVLNQWEDWVQQPLAADAWGPPTYMPEEVVCLMQVNTAWNSLCDATPQNIDDERTLLESAEWATFETAAGVALGRMRLRGRLAEETKPCD